MLTSLYIEKPEYRSGFAEFCGRLLPDRISVEVRQADFVKIKCISYRLRSGRVNYKKLDKIIGAQRNRLLCDKALGLPKELGYRRYENNEFLCRMCTNVALCILSRESLKNVTVGLVDTDASFTTLPEHLLRYTDSVVVVSDKTDVYSEVAETILYETGAPLRLSKTTRSLYDCDIVIAPKGVDNSFSLKQNAVVLTTKKPESEYQITVVYDYNIELPQYIRDICPEGIDDTYFASALYTLGHMYKLGSLIPTLCVSNNGVQTVSSLRNMLNKQS